MSIQRCPVDIRADRINERILIVDTGKIITLPVDDPARAVSPRDPVIKRNAGGDKSADGSPAQDVTVINHKSRRRVEKIDLAAGNIS